MDMIINLINQFGYISIGLLIAIENIFPPIPSEVILTFGGFMTTFSHMNIWGVILFATAGSLAGALVLYWVGILLNTERLERWLTGKWGKMLHIRPEDVEKARVWFLKRGEKAVFFCRFVPIVRSLISIPAGMTKMNMTKFLLFTLAGSVLWNTLLIFLGAYAGSKWESIVDYIGMYSKVILVLIFITIVACVILFYKKRLTKKHNKDEDNIE